MFSYSVSLRLVFWVEGGEGNSVIKSARFNGTGSTTVVSNVVSPSDIAVDIVRDRLYWISGGGMVIESDSFTGSDRTTVFTSSRTVFLRLAVFEDYIYATVPASNSIARIDKFQREGETIGCLLINLPQ